MSAMSCGGLLAFKGADLGMRGSKGHTEALGMRGCGRTASTGQEHARVLRAFS